MFRKSPVLRKEDHLHSQVPLKCRLHRAETSSCCCKAVLLAVANSAAAASGANATLQKKKNRYSGEIAAFNTSKGAVIIGLKKVSKLSSVPLAAVSREASLAVGCIGTSSWNGQTG